MISQLKKAVFDENRKIFIPLKKKRIITQCHYKMVHCRWHYLIFFDGLFSLDVLYKSSHSLTANNTKCKERPPKINNNSYNIYTWRNHFWQQRTPLTDSVHWCLISSAAISRRASIKHGYVSFVFLKPTDWNFEVNTDFGTPGKYTTRSVLFSRFSF